MDVLMVGGGVIGLATAWRSLAKGLTVTVFDPEPASKASHVSAGMLPGGNESLYGLDRLLRLCLASRDRYPSFAAELESDAGLPSGYRRDGVLEAAYTAEDLAGVEKLSAFEAGLGVATEMLTAEECRKYEPALAPEIAGGMLNPDDGAVDPRALCGALLAAIRRLGGTVRRERVVDVLLAGGRVSGVRLENGETVSGDQTVLAAGCWSHLIGGLPEGTVPEVRPGKGQILRLRSPSPFLARTLRGHVDGHSVFLVPREDGELVVGATHEDTGYDTTVTAGGLWELLEIARRLLPGLDGLEFAEFSAGLRPGSPDGLPLLGATAVPGLLLATGHSRIGVQLAPVTADVVSDLLMTGELADVAKPFSPLRFRS